ncbi:MAG: putative Ig domain-containing protein [Dehalococcoidales bacterium]|nr:putative Ig domain-containing protein [Dehalococcoidales bacterium]
MNKVEKTFSMLICWAMAISLIILIMGWASQLYASGPIEKQPINFNIQAVDPDGGEMVYQAEGLPAGATLDSSTGAFSWIPNYAQAGVYNIRFTVTDGELTDYEDITITVNRHEPPEDVNFDNLVNILDIIAVSQHFNETGTIGWSPIDVGDDGFINILDLIKIGNKIGGEESGAPLY